MIRRLAALLSFVSCLSLAEQGPMVVWLDINDVDVSRQQIVRYQNILKDTFKRPVRITRNELPNVDAIIVDRLMRTETDGWITSTNLLDVIPGFTLVTLSEQTPDNPLIGQLQRPFMLKLDSQSYPLNDMTIAADMLTAGRIEAILDYRENGALYQIKNQDFKLHEIRPHTSIRVAFKSKQMARTLDNALYALAGVEQNAEQLNDVVKDIQLNDTRDILNWYLVVKQFDPVDNKLHATPEDIAATQWLQEKWPHKRFNILHTNTNTAYEKLASQESACVFNTGRNPQRESMALYSDVTFVFLDFHLYTLADSPADQSLQKWTQDYATDSVNMLDYFEQNDLGLIGYYQYLLRLKGYEEAIKPLIEKMPERFIEIRATGPKKSITLLDQERIDYLLIPPYLLQFELSESERIGKLSSYRYSKSSGAFPTHLACSRSEEGQAVVSMMNQVLADPNDRQELFKLYTRFMINADVPSFIREFDRLSTED